MTRLSLLLACMLAILNQSAHVGADIITAINTLLPGHVGVDVFVDGTNLDTIFDGDLTQFAGDPRRVNYDMQTSAPANHAPYLIGSNSYAGYTPNADATAVRYGRFLNNWAFTLSPSVTGPPVMAATVARIGVDGTSAGIEFAVPATEWAGIGYGGSLSTATALITGGFASFASLHPAFTPADIKAAFRQSSANWSTGWDPAAYGFGQPDWPTAKAIGSDPSALYLQAPYFDTNLAPPFFNFSVFPFLQSRRALDRVFAVPHGYAWPSGNGLTNSDVLDADGIEIASNNSKAIYTAQLNLEYLRPGSYDIIAFTCDAHGNFSRVEEFCRVAFTV